MGGVDKKRKGNGHPLSGRVSELGISSCKSQASEKKKKKQGGPGNQQPRKGVVFRHGRVGRGGLPCRKYQNKGKDRGVCIVESPQNAQPSERQANAGQRALEAGRTKNHKTLG